MTDQNQRLAEGIVALAALMARLRDRDGGCPWDLEQSFETIAPYTIEEAYEVSDAIERGSRQDLREELGDLLFQVLFHARLAEEEGAFDLAGVFEGLSAKMTARHPHVFGAASARTAEEQTRAWEEMKAQERAAKADGAHGLLADVPINLPALTRAEKLTKRAARLGFDWPDAESVREKLREELEELREAEQRNHADDIEDELGDVLFVIANLARKLGVDPEKALRRTNAKFVRRFEHMEASLRADGKEGPQELSALDTLWAKAKRAERGE